MGYRFKRSDPDMTAALRRIASEQIDKALASAGRREDLHEGIHDARKKCKKLRGLIRLVRPSFADYARENAALRAAAHHLAALRERGTGLETLDRLLVAHPDDINQDAAETLREALDRRARAGAVDGFEAGVAAFQSDLAECRRRIAAWTLDKTGFPTLAGGLQGTYTRARTKMRIARRTRAPQDLHDWRKEVKYHWYHTRLLKPLKPNRFRRRAAQASALSDMLGDHHDLVDFKALLASGTLPEAASAALLAPAAAEMARLETAAFDLGRTLFAERPQALVRHWRNWWKEW